MMRSDRRTDIGAPRAPQELTSTGSGAGPYVPADIAGKLIVLGVVLAFSFFAPAAPGAGAIGARSSEPRQDKQSGPPPDLYLRGVRNMH
jgi:hypothetical protein